MKKIFALFLVLILIFSLCACNNSRLPNNEDQQSQNSDSQQSQNDETPSDTGYKLTVIDFWGYLVKPLDKYYEAGEEIEVTLAFLSGPSVGIELNGKYIGVNADTKYDGVYPVITFTMPEKDSVIYTTQNGNIGFKPKFSYVGSIIGYDIFGNALNSDKLNDKKARKLPIYKFDTLSDFEKFKNDCGGEKGFNSSLDDVPSLNQATRNCDESFFEKYTLMLVCIETSSSIRFGFKDVTLNDNYFCAHIEQTNNPQGWDSDLVSWAITVEVPDSMIADITEFDADLLQDKFKLISSIDDNSSESDTSEWNEIFYGDKSGFYMFLGKSGENVTVNYMDGTAENVKDALRNGHIEISNLDFFGVEYYVQSMSQFLSSISHFNLSLDDLKAKVESYGESLTWSNFDRYYSYSTSSGKKTLYMIDENYALLIIGDSTAPSPEHIYLVHRGNMNNLIDVRSENIDEFVNANSSSDTN